MPSDSGSESPARKRERVSLWIKIFVVLHLIAITSWSLPNPPDELTKGKEKLGIDRTGPVAFARSIGRDISDGSLYYNQQFIKTSPLRFYLVYSGFWQYWDMFSPNPASIDFYGTALITYKDGTTKLYTYPRMYDMPIPEKYVSERYRKFYERAHTEDEQWIWPTFAQRVALLNDNDPNNPPVKVVLTRHWQTIMPPPGYWLPNQKPPPNVGSDGYVHYNYFTYTVDQAKLAHDKAAGWRG